MLDVTSWQNSPIRFLIVDLSLVAGVDLSSAEAFVRVQRLLAGRDAILVLCGFALDSEVGKALENVDLFREDGVELFSCLNEALECRPSVIKLGCLMSDSPYRDGECVLEGVAIVT